MKNLILGGAVVSSLGAAHPGGSFPRHRKRLTSRDRMVKNRQTEK
jgi:hypothetical protein